VICVGACSASVGGGGRPAARLAAERERWSPLAPPRARGCTSRKAAPTHAPMIDQAPAEAGKGPVRADTLTRVYCMNSNDCSPHGVRCETEPLLFPVTATTCRLELLLRIAS
jgi:hypothetical protein